VSDAILFFLAAIGVSVATIIGFCAVIAVCEVCLNLSLELLEWAEACTRRAAAKHKKKWDDFRKHEEDNSDTL